MASPVPISKRLILRNATTSVITRLINAAILVWLIQHLLKRISAEQYALLPIAMAVMFLVPVLTVVIRGGLARFVTEAYARDDQARVRRIASTMVPVAGLVGAALLALGGLFIWQVDHLLNVTPEHLADLRLMLGLVIGYFALRLTLSPLTVGLQALQRYPTINAIRLGATLVRATLLLVLILGVSPRVVWVILAQVSAGLFDVALITGLSMAAIPSLRITRGYFDRSVGLDIVKFGGWLSLGSIGNAVRRNADPFILNLLAGPVALNAFHLGWTVDEQFRRLMATGTEPVKPVVTAMHAQNQTKRLRTTFLRGTRLIIWIVMGVVVPVVVFRYEILRLYLGSAYSQYREAATVILLLMSTYPVVYVNSMVSKIAEGRNQLRQHSVRMLLVHGVNLCMTLVLVGGLGLGATGSALATFLAIVTLQPFLIWPVAFALANTRLSEFLRHSFGPGICPALMTAGVAVGLRELVQPAGWLSLLAAVALTLGIYAGCCWLMFTEQDRRESYTLFNRVTLPIRRLLAG